MDMKVELKIKLGVPTEKGRVYKEDALESMVKAVASREVFVTHSDEVISSGVPLKDAVGVVKEISKGEGNMVQCSFTTLAGKEGLLDKCEFSTSGYGELERQDDGTFLVKNYQLEYIVALPRRCANCNSEV